MKKFLFVALIGGALVACNDTSSTNGGVDTSSQAYKDSVAAASAPATTTPDTNMMSTPDTGMMKSDTSSMMSADTSKMK